MSEEEKRMLYDWFIRTNSKHGRWIIRFLTYGFFGVFFACLIWALVLDNLFLFKRFGNVDILFDFILFIPIFVWIKFSSKIQKEEGLLEPTLEDGKLVFD